MKVMARGANCSLNQVDIVSHISINVVCSGRVRQNFHVVKIPLGQYSYGKFSSGENG